MDNKGKSAAGAASGDEPAKEQLAMSEVQFEMLMRNSLEAARAASKIEAQLEVSNALPGINQRIESVAAAAASEAAAAAVARRSKVSALKQYGITAGISTAVFVAGSLAMIGYDRYTRRDRQDQNQQQ